MNYVEVKGVELKSRERFLRLILFPPMLRSKV
jgi:hypothetical protein